MKSSTVIVMGINNVGDAKDRPEIFNGTFSESIVHLAKWISSRSIATRIDLVFARTEEEARNGLRIREQANTNQIIPDELKSLFEGIIDGENSGDN